MRLTSILRLVVPARLSGECAKLSPHAVLLVVDDELSGVFHAYAFLMKPRYFKPFLEKITPLCTSLDSDEAAPLKNIESFREAMVERGIRGAFGVLLVGSCNVRDTYNPDMVRSAYTHMMKLKPRKPETTIVVNADSIQCVRLLHTRTHMVI